MLHNKYFIDAKLNKLPEYARCSFAGHLVLEVGDSIDYAEHSLSQ